ncbi:TetR/AcrR family transcriptional regulator [Candidatus Solirubrobacter pratensis]|uniref:TetR/AcrR family transcriptional regulator n=1 Tax=Candidatus Solirubrobacter pratensis TaxID=1298857 RepID=UPI00041E03EC|nr:TetR/AcrR family transcriptional regulator [Candidatus Solirubrobacter pratensis]
MAPSTAPRRRAPRLPIEVRREQVLDAALRIICARGYGAANMEAIARETGVAKTVVYEAFGGRGPLLRALLEREERRILPTLAAVSPPEGDPREVLVAWVERGLRAVRESPAEWRLLLAPAVETPELVREHVEAGRAVVLEQLRALLRPLRPADLELTARAVLAVAERAALDVLDGDAEPDRYIAFARATFAALTG